MATRSTDKPASPAEGARNATAAPRPPILPSAGEPGPALDPRLVAELAGPRWEQSWALTPSIHTPALEPGARQRSWTLAEMLRPFVRDAFAVAEQPTALDLRCGEGWTAQHLLGWGARRVVAVDDRTAILRRARLLRDHFAIASARLQLYQEDEWDAAYEADPEQRFDVVVLAGAPERAGEEAALARARSASRSICAIECRGSDSNAVAAAALAAGFDSVDRVRPPLQGAPLYVLEERDLLIAKAAIGR